MNLKNVFIYIVFLAFNLTSFPVESREEYYKVEDKVMSETEFLQNGVKVQYSIKSSLEEEEERIKKAFSEEYSVENNSEDSFNLIGKYNIEIKLWEEDKEIFVEGTIINEKKVSTKNLMKELTKIQNNKVKSLRYFNYYKGKIKLVNRLKDLKVPENMVEIHNGYISKEKMKDGKEISYGIMEYDTGLQVIIGTPIIFTTY